jgi:hypothetical protein
MVRGDLTGEVLARHAASYEAALDIARALSCDGVPDRVAVWSGSESSRILALLRLDALGVYVGARPAGSASARSWSG